MSSAPTAAHAAAGQHELVMVPVTSLREHPQADSVPLPDPDTYDQMVVDIEARGVQVPLDVLEDGTILDGRTRFRIASNLGRADIPVRVVETDDQYAYMVRAALLRRHMTTSQRKTLAESLLVQDPVRSDRSVAKTVGLHHETVAAVRSAMEEAGVLAETASRIGTNGVEKPAHPRKPQQEEPPIDTSDWIALRGVMDALTAFTENDAARIAATVPPRNRAATARRLRKLGSYLGRIAWTLEGEGVIQ